MVDGSIVLSSHKRLRRFDAPAENRYLTQVDLATQNDWNTRLIRGAQWIAETPQAA